MEHHGWGNLHDDCISLFEYGFSRLHSETLTSIGDIVDSIKIKNAPSEANTLNVTVEETLSATISNTDYIEAFSPSIVLNKNLKAPISSGDVVGTITYDIYNTSYSTNLVAINSVEKDTTIVQTAGNIFLTIFKIVLWAIGIIVGMFILLVLIRAYNITKRNKRRYRSRLYNARFR